MTGATGMLGANLAIKLHNSGYAVRCLKRPESKTWHLRRFPVEWVDGDVTDPYSLERCFAGCDAVFHCAGIIGFTGISLERARQVNIQGVRYVVQAVRRTGVSRLIHCSTVSAIGLREGVPADETTIWNRRELGILTIYSWTKHEGQKILLHAVKQGLDAVVVNPCFMVGPYDPKPSSGKLILPVARGAGIGFPGGANNFVDVRDVCEGMIGAWKKGRSGELYILGGENMSYRDFFVRIARIAGVRSPIFRIPKAISLLGGYIGDLRSRLSGTEAAVTSGAARVAYADHTFSSAKAERELNYRPGPVDRAIVDAHSWYRLAGFLS